MKYWHLLLTMHKFVVTWLLHASLCGLLCIPLTLAATTIRVQQYIQRQFPAPIELRPYELEQLSWVLDHVKRSHEQDHRITDAGVHIEISRALTRLYCLQLLRAGGYNDYRNFVAPQIKSKLADPLTYSGFLSLTEKIKHLHNKDYQLLMFNYQY